MLIDFSRAVEEHLDLIQKYRAKRLDQHHLVLNNFSFWLPDDEMKIQDIITLHHNNVHFSYLVGYLMIPDINKDKDVPSELSYHTFTSIDDATGTVTERPLKWSDLIQRTSLDGIEHVAFTNNQYGQTTVEDLIILESCPDVEVWSVAEYQWKTYNSKWRTFEADEEQEFFTIQKIDRDWRKYFDDYSIARLRMNTVMVEKGGLISLPLPDQKVVAKWRLIKSSEQTTILSQNEIAASETIFVKNTRDSHMRRINQCQFLLKSYLSPEHLPEIADDITNYNLVESYTDRLMKGRGKFNQDGIEDSEGILDYINSTTGNSFATTGLKSKTHLNFLHGMTLSVMCKKITNMLDKGTWE